MKNLLLISILALTGCASEKANLTTTAGSSAALVDNGTNIASGQTITASTITSGTSVLEISGTDLTLTIPAAASGTVSATFKNTVAMQLSSDEAGLKTYGQTLGSALQTILPQLAAAAGDTAKITALVQQVSAAWGLSAVTPSQASAYTKIENGAASAASDLGVLENFLTGLQTTGTVAAATTPSSSN